MMGDMKTMEAMMADIMNMIRGHEQDRGMMADTINMMADLMSMNGDMNTMADILNIIGAINSDGRHNEHDWGT